jgi:phospholipid-binding lipoprotein MlaA
MNQMNHLNLNKIILLGAFALMVLPLTACSTTGQTEQPILVGDEIVSDPLEDVNRAVFAVNEGVDKAVVEPIARGYRYVTPKPIRQGLRNFLRNLKSPIVMGNELLQGDLEGLGNASGRLFINTLLGVGGVFDVADWGGIPYEPEDFGQTLGVWGVGHGPYVILPLMGPSSVRDASGMMVDSFADPVRLYLFNTDREWLHYTRVGLTVLDTREELLDIIDDLRANSFDYYAAIRSAYYQRRQGLVNDMDPQTGGGADIPDYDN